MKKEDIKPKDENGNPHGYHEVYHSSGQLSFKGYYIHGNIYGYWEQYWSNRVLNIKGNFIHGKEHGYCEYYSQNGGIYEKGYYHMGNLLHQTSKNKLLF